MSDEQSLPHLPPRQQLVAPGKWPLVGERESAPGSGRWTIEVCGMVSRPHTYTLAELAELPQRNFTVDLHCVTRWSKLAVPFRGVLLADVLARAHPLPGARFVSFVAQSVRDHSTSLPLAEALALETFLALAAAGAPLPPEHGGPVRTVTPGKYFYKSLKWLQRIELLAEDRLGYWEATAGYHNGANPWREERYLASSLSRQETAALLARRNFSRRDLRGLAAAGQRLRGLEAKEALLRDADFSGCSLTGANFSGANLSNARFLDAKLRNATFLGADLEGADFSGAQLAGADFRRASLFGATFCDTATNRAATLDGCTLIDPEQLAHLTPPQAEFLRQLLRGAR